MGPFDELGRYAETTITTRKTDSETPTDNKPGIWSVLILLLLLGPALWAVTFMVLYLSHHIGWIAPAAIIGLGFWACAYYGTNDSLVQRFRNYRACERNKDRVVKRLSDLKESGKIGL